MGRRKKYNTEEERLAARREIQKRYYQKNKEEIITRQTAYNAAHKEERAAYDAAYRVTHKEEIAAYKAKYNAAYDAERRATPFGRATYLVDNYRRDDKKSNRGECTIDAQWILDNVFSGQPCHYCGETDWHLLGCDRLDNTKPHTPQNVVPCCYGCNKKKGTTFYDDFMRRIGKIA